MCFWDMHFITWYKVSRLIYPGKNATRHGLVQVINNKTKSQNTLEIWINLISWKDCVDDYSKEVFTYLPCTENSTQFKCEQEGSVNFGQCFNLTSSFVGTSEICSTANSTLVESIGYWKTSFPSQDYWQ